MAWISCPGIISAERRGRWWKRETDTNQSEWRHLDFTSTPTPPTLTNFPPSAPSSFLSPVIHLLCRLFCCLFAPGLKTRVYVLHYVCVCV